MARTVDEYLEDHAAWAHVLEPLRDLLRRSELEETVKWGAPVYALAGRNVVGLGAFKGYAGLWFFDGSLLEDPDGVLVNAQEGKTRAMRQWRFGQDMALDLDQVERYLAAAIGNARAGRTVAPRRDQPVDVPERLAAALAESGPLRAAFETLTPGRQREYATYIAEARRAATQERRLAKCVPMILAGKGLNDRYRC